MNSSQPAASYRVPRNRKSQYATRLTGSVSYVVEHGSLARSAEAVKLDALAAKVEAQGDRDFRAEQAAQRARLLAHEQATRAQFALVADFRREAAKGAEKLQTAWQKLGHLGATK